MGFFTKTEGVLFTSKQTQDVKCNSSIYIKKLLIITLNWQLIFDKEITLGDQLFGLWYSMKYPLYTIIPIPSVSFTFPFEIIHRIA